MLPLVIQYHVLAKNENELLPSGHRLLNETVTLAHLDHYLPTLYTSIHLHSTIVALLVIKKPPNQNIYCFPVSICVFLLFMHSQTLISLCVGIWFSHCTCIIVCDKINLILNPLSELGTFLCLMIHKRNGNGQVQGLD